MENKLFVGPRGIPLDSITTSGIKCNIMNQKTRKISARTIITVLVMLIVTPFASFASASNTYASFEDYCDFEFKDDQSNSYSPNEIINYNTDYAIVEVDPGMYSIEFDCTNKVSSGNLEVSVEGRSQDGLTTKDPVTVVPVSTTTINMVSTTVPVSIDATGSIGKIIRVFINIDAVDMNNNHVIVDSQIAIIPMIDTTNDTTPRISFWYGKVNQHNENGTWMTDSDGSSGGGTSAVWGSQGWADRKVEYCQKFWPNTIAVEMRVFVEKINFYTAGNSNQYESYKPVYDCIQEEVNDTVDNDTVENNNESCAISLSVTPQLVQSGDAITLTWSMSGDVSSQIYISIFSGWSPAVHYHNSIEQNTGFFAYTIPAYVDHTQSYHAYVESADNDKRTTICWKYASFEIIGSDNDTESNDTDDNVTNDNQTEDNMTDNNNTDDDNNTGNYTIPEYASMSVMIDGIENSIVDGSVYIYELNIGNDYEIFSKVTDYSGNAIYWTDSYSWEAMSWDESVNYEIHDLVDGTYCLKSELYVNSNGIATFVDQDEHCFIIETEQVENNDTNTNDTSDEESNTENSTDGENPTSDSPSAFKKAVQAFIDDIAQMIAEIFSESEKEEETENQDGAQTAE